LSKERFSCMITTTCLILWMPPAVALPAVALPAVALPAVALPAVALPAVALPAVALPAFPRAIVTPTAPVITTAPARASARAAARRPPRGIRMLISPSSRSMRAMTPGLSS